MNLTIPGVNSGAPEWYAVPALLTEDLLFMLLLEYVCLEPPLSTIFELYCDYQFHCW
jgi:hypothetical protein